MQVIRHYTVYGGKEKTDPPMLKTDYYCPGCGSQPVFVENDIGDYYMGTTYYCITCNSEFYLPTGVGSPAGLSKIPPRYEVTE